MFNDRYLQGDLPSMFKELIVSIQYDEVLKACKQLKTGKSSCPDQMLNEMFMYGCKHGIFMLCLSCLFDKLFSIGYFPDMWDEGCIVPLHKKGM